MSISYDNNGNVKSQTITVPGVNPLVQTYAYDSLNRIKSATETQNSTQTWKQTFIYDRYGNRNFDAANTTTIPTGCSTAQCNPAVDVSSNRFTTGQGYTYDLSGNLITDAQGRTFAYDGENKQSQVRDASNNVIGQYLYDGDGKRVKKISASDTTVFAYDASGKLAVEYLLTSATPSTPTTSYLTNDTLGSPRVITDQSGNVISRRDFMPFGEEITGLGNRTSSIGYQSDSTRQKFTGKELDGETGLDYFGARFYSSTLGKFTTPDPYMPSAEVAAPQSWNRYAYVLNNPLKYIDLIGLKYSDLDEAQRALFQTYADKYNRDHNANLSAEEVYNTLDESQQATFEANTYALEHTQLTDERTGQSLGNALQLVCSVDEIVGENIGGKTHLRLYVNLSYDAIDILKRSKEFSGNFVEDIATPDHKRYDKNGNVITTFAGSLRQGGGLPSLQFSYADDRIQADIDIDYRQPALFDKEGHRKHYNSDIRQVGPQTENGQPINNYLRYSHRWSGLHQWWQPQTHSNNYYEGKAKN